jgi:hypothetical protein
VQDYDKRLMLTFLEDAFTQAQNYRNIRLMRALFERRKEMMDQCSVSDAQDFALLYHDQAVLLAFIDTPPNYPEAVSFLKKGLETLSEVTTENAELKLNCYTNLCAIYLRMEEKELAAETGMEGERFLKSFPFGEGSASNCTAAQVNFIYSKIPVTGIAEAGKQLLGVKRSLDESPMDRTHNLDYATLLINISNIFYKLQDISYWEMYIPQIAEIYKQIFGKNSPEYKEKIANLRGYCPDEVDFDHIIKCRKGSK